MRSTGPHQQHQCCSITLLAWAFLGERLTVKQVIGMGY